jgi:phosphate ABC transporter phosphate-binding protein
VLRLSFVGVVAVLWSIAGPIAFTSEAHGSAVKSALSGLFGRLGAVAVTLVVGAAMLLLTGRPADAAGFVPIMGSGSTWASNAMDQWRRNVASLYGITANYSPNGSASGRNDFRAGQVDFAVSEIPYGRTDGGVLDPPPTRAFGYLPIVAGGTAFMYNLNIAGKRVRNLRLSGETITRIFTKQITNWADPAIQADNPGLVLPSRQIMPVVRSDGSGPTFQFTAWMANQYPALWDDYCHHAGRMITPCGPTSFYPVTTNMVAKAGSQGVAGFVAQEASEGAITYVEYAYARNVGFPVAKMLNAAHYYVEPTAGSVAVALLNATLHPDLTADLTQVYINPDPRTYPLSSYAYMIVPKDTTATFSTEKGRTLSEFAAYFLCEGQQQADTLGYSPLPINLVQAGIDQLNLIPGSTHKLDRNNLTGCPNPTVSPDGKNLLATTAPWPPLCDLQGPTQCTTGTGPPGPPPTPIPTGPPPTSSPPPTSVVPPPPPSPPGPGGGGPLSDSALTVSGKGAFANLRVTVGQTKNLINQQVSVSWTGGAPTQPSGQFGVNYLQIMQCWGDDPTGPDRAQCQYGALSTQTTPSAGTWVRSRQISYGTRVTLIDPKETLRAPADSLGNAFVSFWAVDRVRPTNAATSDLNDFFDAQLTNEIPLARTHSDGTGVESFEIQTARHSPGLGCGEPITRGGPPQGRSCWLVIVPRNSIEVDGTHHSGSGSDRLDSSPLSQSNWDNRIVFPLEFKPVSQSCPIGSPQRRLIGHELISDAVTSWQPALCTGGGPDFSYSQLTDDDARAHVLDGSSPDPALVTNPIPPDQAPPYRPLLYAPVGLSGLAIAFNIDHQPPADASPDQQQLDGVRFNSMKLTPRLVAKLLTQSYRDAVEGLPDYLKNNPTGLTVDPEFLALNPEYTRFTSVTTPPDALVQLGSSDLTSLLWSWIKADPDASAFLAGAPDPYGMVINPYNKNLILPTSTFPRNDQSCASKDLGSGVTGKVCTLDTHPFTTDMHDAGRSASHGDTHARTLVLGPDGHTPILKKLDPQPPGQRALLAIVDTATANRYGLPTAALRNAAGQFVAPTTASLLAGEHAMKPSAVLGVLASDPTTSDPAAYPLTALSYAVATPSTLDTAAANDYAQFLRYVAGPGQQPGIAPGQLPPGMVPLPDALKAQTIAAAATIQSQPIPPTSLPSSPPPPTPPPPPPIPGPGGFVPISGSGSSWSVNALDQWRRNVANLYGITANYSPNGSTSGRNDFRAGQTDFAGSEIPYGLSDGGVPDPPPSRAFRYLPFVAGGTAFMYNLKIGSTRVTNLRLSGETLAKIFTRTITNWSDPAIQAENPGLTLPDRPIVPVVRSDGSGTTAQFTAWIADQYPTQWDAYCHRVGRNITPCGFTSFYPQDTTMVAKAGSQGVAGFVAQDSSEGAITYVEYSYARNVGFPVVKMRNAANYYVEPTAGSVAVALLNTKLHPDLTQDLTQVYRNTDPRTYPLSSYSYLIVPKDTSPESHFTTEKGRTLSEFAAYFLCEGQQQADALGYSPLPITLVQSGVDQINQIPGSTRKLDRNNLARCNNPTVSPDGENLVAKNAPQPPACDLTGPTQCTTGTGGATTPTPIHTPTPSPTSTPTPTTGPPPTTGTTTTTTTLRVIPNPGYTFIPEILIARVSPFNAPGTVQFFDKNITLGAPVPVFFGFALLTTTLPKGTHSLTAVFSPSNPRAGGCSTTVGFFGSRPPPCPTSGKFTPSASFPVSLTIKSLF